MTVPVRFDRRAETELDQDADGHDGEVVLAVAHLKRQPGYWQSRLG